MRAHLAAHGAPLAPPHLNVGPVDLPLAVWGGTSNTSSYYAPNNFGIHAHLKSRLGFLDDSTRVCADVATALRPSGYREFLEPFSERGWFSDVLSSVRKSPADVDPVQAEPSGDG